MVLFIRYLQHVPECCIHGLAGTAALCKLITAMLNLPHCCCCCCCRPSLLSGVPDDQQQSGEALLDDLYAKLKQLELAVKTQQVGG